MLYDKSMEIEKSSINLGKAQNLMGIFIEFSELEGNLSQVSSFEEKTQMALMFVQRYQMYRSLIETIFDIIIAEEEKLRKISDELLEMKREEKAA